MATPGAAGTTTIKTKPREKADESTKFLQAQYNLQQTLLQTMTPPTLMLAANPQATIMQIFAQNERTLQQEVSKMHIALHELQQLIIFNTMLLNLPIAPLTPPTPAPMMMPPPLHYNIVQNQQAMRAQQQTMRQQEAVSITVLCCSVRASH